MVRVETDSGSESSKNRTQNREGEHAFPTITDMSAAVSNIVFDDIFTINAIDKEGKKFDRGPGFQALFGLNNHFYTLQFPDSMATQKIMIWI